MSARSQGAGDSPDVPATVCAVSDTPLAPPLVPEAISASLRASIKDGVAWSVMVGAGERYVNPFIILGDAGLLRLGAISAVPLVVGALVQCLAANLVDAAGRRKPFFVAGAALQGLTWIPFCVGIFLPLGIGYWLMLASFALYIGFGNFGVPAWTSTMGDLVPEDRRGRYFGTRNCLIGIGLIVSTLGAGWWLTYAKDRSALAVLGLSSQNVAFVTIFALALVARFFSVHYLRQMHEPPYRRQPSDHFSLLDFIRRAPRAHFGRFVCYCTALNLGVGFLGPFLFWYMLGELKFSPLAFAVIGAVNWFTNFGSMALWGNLADRVGSKRVLGIGGIGMAAVPLLLLLGNNFWWFVIVQAYDGMVLAAYQLAAVNYLLDVVTPPKRARCAAYHALFVALGTATGTFAAVAVGLWIPVPLHVAGLTIGHPFQMMLIGSAALRLLPNLLLLGSFDEFRLSRPVFFEARVPGP